MKKALLFCVLLSFFICSFAADGIQFTQGSWKEILLKAKTENKLVFIDVYTSWCGPCKMMVADVFPKKEVGDLFNTSFINYKIDAEKGEGIAIAKQFGVRAYPTYLFVNGDGVLVYRITGYMPPPSFLQEAHTALKEKEDPKPFVQWEVEYEAGKRNKDFLLGYLKKRALLKLPSAEIVEEVFPMLSPEELANREIFSIILVSDHAVEYVPQGRVFNYVIKNYKTLDSSKLVRYPLGLLEMGINNYFQKNIIPNKRVDMLPVTISAYKQVMQASNIPAAEIIAREKELTMKYYSGVGNEAAFGTAVTDFVQDGLLKLDISAKQAADTAAYAKFMEPYLGGKIDSAKDEHYAMSKRLKKNEQMISISYRLRDAAEAVYDVSNDKALLLKATAWAKQANDYFPHFSSAAVYAGLLFKTGQPQQAIEVIDAAAKDPFLSANSDVYKLLLSNRDRMKQAEAPKSLWKMK